MPKLFGRGKDKKKEHKHHGAAYGRKQPSPNGEETTGSRHSVLYEERDSRSTSPAPTTGSSASLQNLQLAAAIAGESPVRVAVPPGRSKAAIATGMKRDYGIRRGSVKTKKELYESLGGGPTSPVAKEDVYKPCSPEKRRLKNESPASSISVSIPSLSSGSTPASVENLAESNKGETVSGQSSLTLEARQDSFLAGLESNYYDIGKEKTFEGMRLYLPPLQTARVKHRSVMALRNAPGGGFGFILRKSYLPVPEDPDKTRLVHLVEPRSDYFGPLMTGDRIIEVSGMNVEDAPHEAVVELIKSAGDGVALLVASMPELVELNSRGAFDDPLQSRNAPQRKSGRMKAGGTGTLRKRAGNKRKEFKAKSIEEVLSEKDNLEQERVWVVHRDGFSLGTIVQDSPSRSTKLSTHINLIRYQGRESYRVQLQDSGELLEVAEEDLEKSNSPSQDKVEDIVDLVHLNESSVLHVLRQRYASSLIHTFAGKYLIVMNPIRPLSSYVDRVIDMFRGCRREDMPPHIFAAGQQAYRTMMVTRSDQSLILMGLSGSGKTFNARYLLRYLTTISQPEHGSVSNAKLDAVELLLHSFGSAATYLNSQASRCVCLYTLDFDPSGSLLGALVRTYLPEKHRLADRQEGEGNFNIFYQLLAGADEQLKSDLLLNAQVETEESNLYIESYDDPQRIESAAYVWDLIQNCLEILGISQEEALGLWSLLAAIYHLGFAGVKKGSVRGGDFFLNPAAAQRAAAVLGINHEDLGRDIFNPPRGTSLRLSNLFSPPSTSSPTPSDTTSLQGSIFGSIHGSPMVGGSSGSRSLALDAFVMGLYDQAFNALVMLINRSVQSPTGVKGRLNIHVLDTPGFQHRELAGVRNGASFDDLCMNYAQERLQMLFHDLTFTSEQDRYLQEEINWLFSEVAASPLPIIDTIDKHVPQRRGAAIDLHADKRGLLWILDEESVFPGASDNSFLERVHMYHGEPDERGEAPLIKVMREENQFIINHCHRSLPVLYDANGWVRRAREHPSFRVVVQIVAQSKRPSVVSIFQGRGVAASATNIGTSALKADTGHHGTLSRTRSSQASMLYNSPSSGIKRSSVCLQTKFQLDFLIDTLRKTRQWFIRCILPQPPYKLPGALPSPDPQLQKLAGPPPHGHINVPLVRAQLRRADIVKAARMFKQGYPEHMSFPEFRRRYWALLGAELIDGKTPDKDVVEQILAIQEVDRNSYKTGLSQVFFRAGILSQLDHQVEDTTHDTMVLFQARCKGWVGRRKFEKLEVHHSAAIVIQNNVSAYFDVREWSWWKLYVKVKPLLAMWRTEEEMREKDEKIDKLKGQVEKLESERGMLKETENMLEEKMEQMTTQLEEAQMSATQALEMLENEQLEKRHLEEELSEISTKETELAREKEQLHLQIAEMSILARIKQSEEGEEEEGSVLEKYWEARRELETLRSRVKAEHEDELERLGSAKRSLEKKLADSENEVDDLHKTLTQVRKKATKLGSELNDLKLHLESQQSRNAELEKRQRKFDADLNSAKEEATNEVLAKEKLAREKDTLHSEYADLQEKLKELKEENERIRQEKEDLESEVLSHTSQTTESEITSLKRMKRELESKVDELEDELDEANVRADSLQQSKARLELAIQTTKQQHQKELESRDEEIEQIKNAMSKKVKSLSEQLEEVHEEKQAAVKARRDIEREMLDYQGKLGDPEMEKKLRKKIQKYKALVEDLQDELEHEREMRSNSAMVKSLRNQLEDVQASELSAVKAYKRLQGELEDMQTQNDELTRTKMELDSRVSELSREKSDLDTRLEEDQDEIDDLLEKQRSHISQMSSLQSQLAEAHIQTEEVVETKQQLENKVSDLLAKISDLESGVNRQQYEASEVKVRELEQKLELERSSARRHEAQIQRLRTQMERLQEDRSEDVSAKSGDALKRMQKQLRDLRSELQDGERREQEQTKKRRLAEAQIEDLEAQLQTARADLKSAQKRIDTLHNALKGQEEEYGSSGLEESYSPRRHNDSLGDDLSSSGSSYKVGQYDDSSSDEEGITRRIQRISRGSLKSSPKGSRGTTPRRRYSDDFEISRTKRDDLEFSSRRARSRDPDDEFVSRKKDYLSKLSDDEDFTTRRTRRRKFSDEDDLEFSTSRKDYRSSKLSDDEIGSRDKKSYSSKLSDDEDFTTRRTRRRKFSDEDDLEFSTSRKDYRSSKLSDDDDFKFNSQRREDELAPKVTDLDESMEVPSPSKRIYSRKMEDDDDDILEVMTTRRRVEITPSDEEEELLSRRKKTPERSTKLDGDLDLEIGSRRSRRDRSAGLEDDDDLELGSRYKRKEITFIDDEDTSTSKKTVGDKIGDVDEDLKRDLPSKFTDKDDLSYSKDYSTKEDYGVTLNGTSETISPKHQAETAPTRNDGNSKKVLEHQPSKEILTDEQQQVYSVSRRRRQRRRTREAQLQRDSNPTSPEHQKSNGDNNPAP